jgi:TrmH family RNA methyltransferase
VSRDEYGSDAPAESASNVISSSRNSLIVAASKLHRSRERAHTGQTLIEGGHLLAAAVRGGLSPGPVFALEEDQQTAVFCRRHSLVLNVVEPRVLVRLAPTVHPQGPIAILDIPSFEPLAALDTIVLAGVADPGNAGTLVRSAVAFGFQVAMMPGTVDIWSPRVLRAAAGAHFALTFSRLAGDPLAELDRIGLQVHATLASGGSWPPQVADRPMAILVGSESHGLGDVLVRSADESLTIPVAPGVESLNVGVAGSLAMFEVARQRNQGRAP